MPAHIQELREMLARERGVLLPGAPNALAARVTPFSRSACFPFRARLERAWRQVEGCD
jgi:hypothetical protein